MASIDEATGSHIRNSLLDYIANKQMLTLANKI
jgi:hypothetical protein